MKNLFDLSGKVALITGGSSGMGKAIAEAMAMHGATVVISSNDEKGCQLVTNELRARKYDVDYVISDVANREEVEYLFKLAIARTGKIDILVSCVGLAIPGSILETTPAEYEKTFAINLQSAILISKLVIPQMVERNDGVLIYLGSISGLRGNKNLGLYGLSKAALIQLARNLAVEYGPNNIRINTISPGVIETAFAKPMLENEEVMKKRLSLTPLRRIGQPEEVAGVAVMLASKAGGFITGQNIIVDGGTVISDGN